jgi:hypothetical protein
LPIVYSPGPPRLQPAIEQAPFHEWVLPDGTPWTRFYRSGPDYLLRFPALADFEVAADGLKVRSHPVPGISADTVQHLYSNQVLPLALSKQGQLVFHAGAIETRTGALAFMGESGKGKSTLTASFATTGFRFLTDDALLVEAQDGVYTVQPSHASIRLWQDSQQALVGEAAVLAPPVQYTPKARILSGDTLVFCSEAQPLRRVYFLGDGSADSATFQRMTPSEALVGLIRNAFLLDIEEQPTLAAHFDQLSKLVSLPIYYRLDYPRRYEDLAAVRQAIIEHASQESESA